MRENTIMFSNLWSGDGIILLDVKIESVQHSDKEEFHMAISYQEQGRIFTIETQNTTYQMKADTFDNLLHLYYGAKIRGNVEYMLPHVERSFSGNPSEVQPDRNYSLDVLPQEYPTLGTGDYRNKALVIRNGDGTESCSLKYQGYQIKKGKYALPGLPAVYAQEQEAETLEIYLEDVVSRVKVSLLYGVLEAEDIITRSAVISNESDTEITIEKAASACLDFLWGKYDLISFYGSHAMERNFQRSEVVHGSVTIGSRRGTSSHQYNPAVILAERNTTEDVGNCYGMCFVYSGGFLLETEKDQFEQVRVIMGLQPELFHYPLKAGESFVVPETILSFSKCGFSGLTRNYHKCIRNHIVRGRYQNQVRPILINSWEAAYFDFDGNTILQLAKDAAELGIDMVVMDDGWFGKRDDDNSSLGDWVVNEKKLGCSLGELIQRINAEGVQFGIWIEPEMISEDSDLYRSHPDWALQIPGRTPIRARNQLVLDFTREEVRTYIFDSICKVLDQGNVAYIKYDMNRSLANIYSQDRVPGKVLYDYVLGVYDFTEKLIQRYPHILIEGCSGGGGRFDAGMMYYTPQIWCSDNTDAIDRTKIQYGSSFFYPISVTGSHVSAVPNHQTGRVTGLKTRGVVAMAGTFGYELNPRKMTATEREEVKEQVATYKKHADLIQQGDYFRLSNPFTDGYAAWLFVSEDKRQALFSAVLLDKHANTGINYVRLKGLSEDHCYRNAENGLEYAGAALMEAGIPLPQKLGEYESYQLFLERK